MTLEHRHLSTVTRDDLQVLVSDKVPENIRLEYKRDLYGHNDNSKKELLKDISALANSQGGHLIIGIDESNGVAASLFGVVCDNPDEETLRMEQVIRSGVEPNIAGIRIHYLNVFTDTTQAPRYCYIIRIPKSTYPPHRVMINHHNRFYMRNSAGVHEPDIEELRQLFSQSNAVENALNASQQQSVNIHPLNLYGFLLSGISLIRCTIDPTLANQQWFIAGILLHLAHALLAQLFASNGAKLKVTYYIQICILACMLLGFTTSLIAWLCQ